LWNPQTRLGSTFSASTVFKLPNGADRSFDTGWIQRQRWGALTPAERCKFPPIVADFVIELRSATDALPLLQAKMQEYLNAGLRLAGLINPQQQQVEIDSLRQTPARRNLPTELSGEDVLPEFSLIRSLLKLNYLRCGEHTQPDRCSAIALTTNSPYPIPYTPE
jgi:Uma2 family endonuclease